jgi:hypothetical protein
MTDPTPPTSYDPDERFVVPEPLPDDEDGEQDAGPAEPEEGGEA